MKTLHRLPDSYFTENTHYSSRIMSIHGDPITRDSDAENWAVGYTEVCSREQIRILYEVYGELFWLTYSSDSGFINSHFEFVQ